MRNAAAAFLLAAVLGAQAPPPSSFDLIIEHGRVVDGTGSPWYQADIGVRGDTIVAIGSLQGATAKQRIRVDGQIVAPGFIDVHSHAGRYLPENPKLESHIRQGV